MDDRFNTASGWVLFSGIVALGASIASGMYFHADSAPPCVEGECGLYVDAPEDAAAGAKEMTIAEAMTMPGVDVSAGENVFKKCVACHTIDQGGSNGIGPNLYGIMGKSIGGGAPGFAYSSALADKGGQWDWDNMSEWLKSPRAFANGTKMSFAGLSSAEDRADVILYMLQNGGGPALPEPEPEEAEPAEGEAIDDAVEGGDVSPVDAAGADGDLTAVPEAAPAT